MDDLTLLYEFRRFWINERRPGQKHSSGGRGYVLILNCLSPGEGKTQREIADLVEIRAQTVSEALAGMEEQGLIQRVADPRDRRAVRVMITEKGLDFRADRERGMRRRAEELFSVLSEEEKETMYAILQKLRAGNEVEEKN